MYVIPSAHLRSHITICTDLIWRLENYVTEAEKNKRYSSLVKVMAISSRRADNLYPWKSIDNVQFELGERIIVVSAYDHSTGMERRWM